MSDFSDYGLPTEFGRKKPNNRRMNQDYNARRFPDLSKDIEEVFNKKYVFNCKQNIHMHDKLPNPKFLFTKDKWRLVPFQNLKNTLNTTKSKLNDLNLKDWHQHTNNMNTAGEVIKKVKNLINPELLTQAWCKLYECLMTFNLVPIQWHTEPVNTVHLCEAPGAFVTSLYHYLQSWYPTSKWKWLATTLNPYYEGNPVSEMVQDDRFILNSLSHWTFGEDGTGNLMESSNLRHLQEQVILQLGGDVMLVTADGSIDCQGNPAEQECLVAPLQFCETLAAITVLQPGGSFVLKMFTLLECESLCLIYLLVSIFAAVCAFKPVKSKEGNSEVYIICTGFVGRDSLLPWLTTLFQHFGPSINKAMFAEEDIPEDFKEEIYGCAKYFTDLQINVIERNLDLFNSPDPERLEYQQRIKRGVAEKYLEHFQLISVHKCIVGNDILAETHSYNTSQRNEQGTHSDRVNQGEPSPVELVRAARAAVGTWPFSDPICWFVFNSFRQPEVDVTSGKPLTIIQTSKFCHNEVMEVFNRVLSGKLTMPLSSEIGTSVTVEARMLPWAEIGHSDCHRSLLELLNRTLGDLPEGKSVCILGLPLFTQFAVAVVLLLAHSFYQVGLSVGGNVILCGYKQAKGSTKWINKVLSIMSSTPPTKAVLSLLPMDKLCSRKYSTGDGYSLYYCITKINNERVLRSVEIGNCGQNAQSNRYSQQ